MALSSVSAPADHVERLILHGTLFHHNIRIKRIERLVGCDFEMDFSKLDGRANVDHVDSEPLVLVG